MSISLIYRCEHWDGNNENLHGDWFEQNTQNPDISMDMFTTAHNADPNAKLYFNEYGLVQYPEFAVVRIVFYMNVFVCDWYPSVHVQH